MEDADRHRRGSGPPRALGPGRVRVVPAEVWFQEKPFAGDRAAFWKLLRAGTYPSTTPPTVSALAEAYRHHDLVCAIHVSADLSATVARAHEAAARAGPGVIVIDTRSISVGAGLIVAATGRAAHDPAHIPSVIDFARNLPDRLHTFALVQDPDALRRSGRAGLIPKDHLRRGHPLLLAVRGRAILLDQPKDRPTRFASTDRTRWPRERRSRHRRMGNWAGGRRRRQRHPRDAESGLRKPAHVRPAARSIGRHPCRPRRHRRRPHLGQDRCLGRPQALRRRVV